MIIENLSTLKINKLSQKQYKRELAAGNIDEYALYLTPDEELKNYVTPEMFGAVGDGVTDDTASVQEALTYENVLFSKKYRISSPLHVNDSKILFGVAGNEIICDDENMNTLSCLNINSDNVVLKNLCFTGSTTIGGTQEGIRLVLANGVKNILIDSCTFRNNLYNAIGLFNCEKVKVINSNFFATDCGIITMLETANDLFIDNCYFDGYSDDGIFSNFASEPISIFSSVENKNVTISNCIIKNKPRAAAIACSFQTRGIIENVVINNIVIVNCDTAITMTNAENITVSNITATCSDYSTLIVLENTKNCSFSNMTLDCTHYSIHIDSDSEHNMFSNIKTYVAGEQESEARIFYVGGHHNTFSDIQIVSKNAQVHNMYIDGTHNKFYNINVKKYASEVIRYWLSSTSGYNVCHRTSDINVYYDYDGISDITNYLVSDECLYIGMASSDDFIKLGLAKIMTAGKSQSETDNVFSYLCSGEIPLLYENCNFEYIIYCANERSLTFVDTTTVKWNVNELTVPNGSVVKMSFIQLNNKWYVEVKNMTAKEDLLNSSIRVGIEITDITQITTGGMYYSSGNVTNAPSNDETCYNYYANSDGGIITIIAVDQTAKKVYTSANSQSDETTWVNSGWVSLISSLNFNYDSATNTLTFTL